MQTISPDRKLSVFYVESATQPLPCILCGERPKEGEKVVERVTGEPAWLCGRCVQSAMQGFEDLDYLSWPEYQRIGL